MDPIFIVAAGILGAASFCIALLAFYGFAKITGSKYLRLNREWNMASLFVFWIFATVVAAFTMAVYPSIDGLARLLHRLFA